MSLKETLDRFREYSETRYGVQKYVKVSSVHDVLTEAQIEQIKRSIDPKKKECYKNAMRFSLMFGYPYVEGFAGVYGVPVDHAFNRVGDKYVDITYEMACGSLETEYAVRREFTQKEVTDYLLREQMYSSML